VGAAPAQSPAEESLVSSLPVRRRRPACLLAATALVALTLTACVAAGAAPASLAPDATPGVGDPAAGKALFTAKACNGCHRVSGEINGGVTGPDLKGFASRPTIAGAVPNTPENVWRWLADPPRLKPGTPMPRIPLTAQNLDDLTAYLETLK
jgi:cytochrome c1